MATFTTNCQLHQWAPEDNFLRSDFNEDFAKIDAAIGTKAGSASVDSRFSAVNSSVTALTQRVEVLCGTYNGSGAASRTISLGFTPKAVLLEARDGSRAGSGGAYGGLALPGAPVIFDNTTVLSIVTNGFQVAYVSFKANTNTSGILYRYIVLK